MLDIAIIGGGPAGLTAGMYATRGGVKNVTLFEKGILGGQITQSSEIENYPGYPNVVSGMDFMEHWPEQAMRFGLKHETKEVLKVEKENELFNLTLTGGESVKAKSVIVCTGSNPRSAGFKGEKEFFGRGVSSCATCDGFFYKGKEVAVLGGGDTALEEALHLAKICSKVYIIHRRDEFRAAPVTVEKVKKSPNIELILNAKIDRVFGGKMGVDGVEIIFNDKKKKELLVPGIFVFVGMDVNNEILKQNDGTFLCKMSKNGEVIVDLSMKTDVDGLFAAGDMRIQAPKQVVSAAGDGAIAALSAMEFLN